MPMTASHPLNGRYAFSYRTAAFGIVGGRSEPRQLGRISAPAANALCNGCSRPNLRRLESGMLFPIADV